MKANEITEIVSQNAKRYIDIFFKTIKESIDDLKEKYFVLEKVLNENTKNQIQLFTNLQEIDGKIKERISCALEEFPKPKDGKDADPEQIKDMIDEVFAKIKIPADGKAGESVTLEDVEPLIAVAVKAAFDAFPKPQDGKDADYEKIERMVEKAIQAQPRPKDGLDGRDVLNLEIEPEIDIEKSYPRNTYATHNGGFWRSFEKTNGMRGWECIIAGYPIVKVKQDEERIFTIQIEKSTKEIEEFVFETPVMIYRGVYKQGDKYRKGDVVTYAGSTHHCNADTEERPATGSKDWTLCVKRGLDAKESYKRPDKK